MQTMEGVKSPKLRRRHLRMSSKLGAEAQPALLRHVHRTHDEEGPRRVQPLLQHKDHGARVQVSRGDLVIQINLT